MAKSNKVSYVQQEEPSFLKQFKERIGYKEGPNVDTKRRDVTFDPDADDRPETEEDKPVVVVLREGDLTAEEANLILEKQTPESPTSAQEEDSGGRIMFKKPVKRSSDSNDLKTSSTKKKKDNESETKSSKKEKSTDWKVTNASLLSFDDEEEEED